MRHLGALSPAAHIVAQAQDDSSCASGKRATVPGHELCISPADVARYGVPPGYTPPGVEPGYAPESKTGLYVGLGVGAVVIVGGLFLLFGRD